MGRFLRGVSLISSYTDERVIDTVRVIESKLVLCFVGLSMLSSVDFFGVTISHEMSRFSKAFSVELPTGVEVWTSGSRLMWNVGGEVPMR